MHFSLKVKSRPSLSEEPNSRNNTPLEFDHDQLQRLLKNFSSFTTLGDLTQNIHYFPTPKNLYETNEIISRTDGYEYMKLSHILTFFINGQLTSFSMIPLNRLQPKLFETSPNEYPPALVKLFIFTPMLANATTFAQSLSTLHKYLISNLNVICTRIHPFYQPNSYPSISLSNTS